MTVLNLKYAFEMFYYISALKTTGLLSTGQLLNFQELLLCLTLNSVQWSFRNEHRSQGIYQALKFPLSPGSRVPSPAMGPKDSTSTRVMQAGFPHQSVSWMDWEKLSRFFTLEDLELYIKLAKHFKIIEP